MTKQKLLDDIERLRNEIEQLGDGVARERLNRLLAELEDQMERRMDDNNGGLMKNLKEAVAHFETEHPRTTAILNDIMVTLSNMGI